MVFKFLVIGSVGFPIFEYPSGTNVKDVDINSVLFSGLMSAINSYSIEATGHIIGDMKFGSMQSTFSKDGFNNLYVVITGEDIPIQELKQIHMEIKSLFLNSVDEIGLNINSEEYLSTEVMLDDTKVESIFEPFYRMWNTRIKGKAGFVK